MIRQISIIVILCVALLGYASCTDPAINARAELQAAVDSYINALKAGDSSIMPLTPESRYIQNMEEAVLGEGIWETGLNVDFHRSLLDTDISETFTEVICASNSHPYVLGTRLKIENGKILEIETLVTDEDDWLFNADVYLKHSQNENWDVLAVDQRSDRQTLIAAADAYFDLFADGPPDAVPWGFPCNRLEGGIYTGKGVPEDTCYVGIPPGGDMQLVDRRYIVDEDIGSVVGIVRFGGEEGMPDSHLCRLEGGKVRYIHTLTVCLIPGCGFPELPGPTPEMDPQ